MKEYREIIKNLRVDRDMNQTDVAKILSTTQQHYSNYEKGENEMPIRAFIILADYYGVTVDYLLGRPSSGQGGYDVMTSKINNDTTVGEMISDLLSLNIQNRDAVVDYIFMQKLKEEHHRQKDKNGSQ